MHDTKQGMNRRHFSDTPAPTYDTDFLHHTVTEHLPDGSTVVFNTQNNTATWSRGGVSVPYTGQWPTFLSPPPAAASMPPPSAGDTKDANSPPEGGSGSSNPHDLWRDRVNDGGSDPSTDDTHSGSGNTPADSSEDTLVAQILSVIPKDTRPEVQEAEAQQDQLSNNKGTWSLLLESVLKNSGMGSYTTNPSPRYPGFSPMQQQYLKKAFSSQSAPALTLMQQLVQQSIRDHGADPNPMQQAQQTCLMMEALGLQNHRSYLLLRSNVLETERKVKQARRVLQRTIPYLSNTVRDQFVLPETLRTPILPKKREEDLDMNKMADSLTTMILQAFIEKCMQ